jgi:CubicO group peptidase (beta-lactamase class C family)
VFKLVENGLIELDKPVAEYWPEFGTNGKEETTVRQVLLHQAGLPRRGLLFQLRNVSNWEKLTQNIENQKNTYPPGSKTSYHTLNFGYILGEVVRRVSGQPIEKYLEDEFLIPMGLNHTSLKIQDYPSKSYPRLYSGTFGHQFIAWLFNSANIRNAVIPAGSLHSTARDLAIFFQLFLNEGLYAGEYFLQPETIRLATSLGYEGIDESLGRTTRWGYGFHLGGDHELNPAIPDGMGNKCSIDTFGHYGQRTSMAWADKRTGLVVVFLCNRFLSSIDYKKRLREISNAVWDALDE